MKVIINCSGNIFFQFVGMGKSDFQNILYLDFAQQNLVNINSVVTKYKVVVKQSVDGRKVVPTLFASTVYYLELPFYCCDLVTFYISASMLRSREGFLKIHSNFPAWILLHCSF